MIKIDDVPISGNVFEPLQDTRWLSHRLKVSEKQARKLAGAGVVPSIRIGRQYRFLPSRVESWIIDSMDTGIK